MKFNDNKNSKKKVSNSQTNERRFIANSPRTPYQLYCASFGTYKKHCGERFKPEGMKDMIPGFTWAVMRMIIAFAGVMFSWFIVETIYKTILSWLK